jgi:hypothetical protein
MGWETRSGSDSLYYLRPKRVDGKVRKVYHGSGERGRAAERAYEAERTECERLHAEVNRQRRREDKRIEALEEPLLAFDSAVKELMKAILEAAGYWKPKHWVWRKRRSFEG